MFFLFIVVLCLFFGIVSTKIVNGLLPIKKIIDFMNNNNVVQFSSAFQLLTVDF